MDYKLLSYKSSYLNLERLYSFGIIFSWLRVADMNYSSDRLLRILSCYTLFYIFILVVFVRFMFDLKSRLWQSLAFNYIEFICNLLNFFRFFKFWTPIIPKLGFLFNFNSTKFSMSIVLPKSWRLFALRFKYLS